MTFVRAVTSPFRRTATKSTIIAGAGGLAIGLLGGTIGVGGGELRLPILIGLLGFATKVAAPINLIVTIITVAGGIAARIYGHAFADTVGFAAEGLTIAAAAAPSAYVGAQLLRRLNNRKLTYVVGVTLLMAGLLMLAEGLLGDNFRIAIQDMPARIALCVVVGAGIGIVVGMLGVGGNELMIPPLVIMFGLPIKEAGSVSLLVSVPVVLVGLWRFQALSAFRHRDRDVGRTIVPLALGSVVGSFAGGFLAHAAPNGFLKLLLGAILIFSAWRTYVDRRQTEK